MKKSVKKKLAQKRPARPVAKGPVSPPNSVSRRDRRKARRLALEAKRAKSAEKAKKTAADPARRRVRPIDAELWAWEPHPRTRAIMVEFTLVELGLKGVTNLNVQYEPDVTVPVVEQSEDANSRAWVFSEGSSQVRLEVGSNGERTLTVFGANPPSNSVLRSALAELSRYLKPETSK